MLRRWLGRSHRRTGTPDDATVRRAFVDEMTELAKRRVFIEHLRAARAEGVRGVVAMYDIDHFKLVNDRHGHETGDLVLCEAAARLRSCLPAEVMLARYGGDEFVAFFPGVQAPEAVRVVEASRDALRPAFDVLGEPAATITVSVGVAAFALVVDDVLRAADIALFAAKARGRDGVVVFDDDTRRIVGARRELAATVAELQERNRALHDQARTDALTGLRNRLALDEALDPVPGDGEGDGRPRHVAVAFIDVDHFGDYNHLHGDGSGDDALRAIAGALRACSRDADLVFRKGGEEFVAVLREATREGAMIAAERMRAAVEALAIAHSGSKVADVLTVTVGVATGGDGLSVRELLDAAADQVMAAKVDHRRNRVHAVHAEGSRR